MPWAFKYSSPKACPPVGFRPANGLWCLMHTMGGWTPLPLPQTQRLRGSRGGRVLSLGSCPQMLPTVQLTYGRNVRFGLFVVLACLLFWF